MMGIGGNYGLALLANGTVSGWGISASANSFGELGDGTTINHTSPAPVRSLSGITQIAGLVLGSVSSAVDNTCNNINRVLSQSPAAGTTQHVGSAVSITLGSRPKTPCP